MTPIEKNIAVVDGQGNEYEATYPRRAKGLVKNGRARFIDENTICLACPPDKISEDKEMDNTQKTNTQEEIKNNATVKTDDEKTLENTLVNLILSIAQSSDLIRRAIEQVEIDTNDVSEETCSMYQKKFDTIETLATLRETTNQKLIELCSKILDRIKPDAHEIAKAVSEAYGVHSSNVTEYEYADDSAAVEAMGAITDNIGCTLRYLFDKK